MKNPFLILKGMLSVSLIVLLVGVAVNHRVSGKYAPGKTQVADGVPLPPPVQPPPDFNTVIIADGVPLPPPVQPPPDWSNVLTADGVPLPPLVQPPPDLAFC